MTEPTTTTSERRFPCKQCGAKLEFAPGTSALKCPYCAAENEIAPDGVAAERDYRTELAALGEAAPSAAVLSVKCGACAAEVTLPPNVTSLSCPFCGSNIVAQPTSASRIRPNAVLPFKVTREEAVAAFRAWVSSRWFAPGTLKTKALLETGVAGVYMPAWTYDARSVTDYVGKRGEAYTVTVGSGKHRRTERRVRWYPASGRVHNNFDDVLVLASHSLPADKAKALDPWDLTAVVPYADDYLAGFGAECYQVDLPAGFALAQAEMEGWITLSIRNDIGGDEQQIDRRHSEYHDVKFKHLLLPVWIAAYRYHDKVYRFLVNARTGEVQGERPYSKIKIAAAIFAGVIVALLLLMMLRDR